MHILSEPVQRHLSTKSLRLRRGIDLGAYGGKLRAEPDVVDEAGDLAVAVPTFDPAAQKIREGRQRFPIDSPRGRMVP